MSFELGMDTYQLAMQHTGELDKQAQRGAAESVSGILDSPLAPLLRRHGGLYRGFCAAGALDCPAPAIPSFTRQASNMKPLLLGHLPL